MTPSGPSALDAIVVGSGPNGLAAAITIAQTGRSVRVYEADASMGGGLRSAALTNPGFIHDVCATVHALAGESPFLKSVPLAEHGLAYAYPEAPFAHPLDDGTAVVVERSIDKTIASLDAIDGASYQRVLGPFVERAGDLMEGLLGPPGWRHPALLARFAMRGLQSATSLAQGTFQTTRARAIVAGAAAHSMVPLHRLATAGYGLALIVSAHASGWPVARGGSQTLADALAAYLRSLGGEVTTGHRVQSLAELPPARAVLCDVTPRQLLQLAGSAVPTGYRQRLEGYRYGPGVFKMDFALNAPVPWRAGECRRAGTIHIGGTEAEIEAAENAVWQGRHPDRPFVLAVQPTCFDSTRAPVGKHTLWAYTHVPNGSLVDMSRQIEQQIERFAPGFCDCIIAKHVMFPADLERRNANLVGGDIAGGAADLAQIIARPVFSFRPYSTAIPHTYLCSSSTPPGVGVHGMCGYYAAHAALKQSLGA